MLNGNSNMLHYNRHYSNYYKLPLLLTQLGMLINIFSQSFPGKIFFISVNECGKKNSLNENIKTQSKNQNQTVLSSSAVTVSLTQYTTLQHVTTEISFSITHIKHLWNFYFICCSVSGQCLYLQQST